jgi:Secretion system C-terminal sorting domain
LLWLFFIICSIKSGFSQPCPGFSASYIATESRCTATGTLQINATGGSGSYNYQLKGTSTSDFTSSSLITGLAPGTYSVIIKDIVNNCTYEIDNIIITGTYTDPRFGLTETDVTCMNGNDGTISIAGFTGGRSPFSYTIVSPSTSGIGTTNSTGTFTGLIPGSYSVQMTDSCGGIQTRNISIQNYNWSISAAIVSNISCTNYSAQISLIDSKGHTNSSGTAFNGFTYGFVNGPADTVWFTTSSFTFDLGQIRTLTLVAKDNCGLVQTKTWTNNIIPSVQANVTITGSNCTGFTATVNGQQNLTTPNFCLVDNLGNPVSGQPCNTTGIFTGVPYGSYCIHITNSCYDTIITRCFTQSQPLPAVSGTVSVSNYTCTSFQATVTGQQNLTSPVYCLLDQSGNPITGVPCNSTGVFPNLPFGSYKIQITDGCTGMILNLAFSASEKVKSVAASVTTNGYTCTTFNGTITGQTNLVSPQYCLVDSVGNPITCNTTGIFNNLNYGSYCINITDACNDTTIKRCMTVTKPTPSGGSAAITNKTCTGFTVTISGQTNMFNGLYCLQDNLGNPVTGVPCNNTGVFNNIPYGSYCVQTTDGCSGATLTNCFTVTAPVLAVGPAVISNITCTGFTATITGQQNLTSPNYCLFDSLNNPLVICNSTGIFVINGFGAYNIQTTDGCSGAVFMSHFSDYKAIPSVGNNVNFTNQSCTSFTATITGQTNLFNPEYYLKDSLGNKIDSNVTGTFSNILYGSYCIDIVSGCLDTTITRCFNVPPSPTMMTVSAAPSCTFNASDLSIQVTTGFAPYTATVYNASDSLLATVNSNSNLISVSGLPALASGNQYKVIVTGTCGIPATAFVTGQQSSLTHLYTITPKCPSSIVPNGSGDLLVAATTNMGVLNMSIIEMNFVPDTIGYSFRSGDNFTFSNLNAATYVVAYTFTGCTTVINDTITLPNYTFPALAPSGAYQCDNNSFSVGAVVSGGISPYNYQIIGSLPSIPAINTALQSNPVFMINNGMQYSLVRLRAIDACGNATLNDVSILPLANTIVTATSNCIYQATTLSVEVVPNATYTWYKKSNMSSTDSVIVGTDPTYSIPAISVADTGIYVSVMSVNSGCLTRISYFNLNGLCNGLFLLPESIKLTGKITNSNSNLLSWTVPAGNSNSGYVVERADANSAFADIGMLPATGSLNTNIYSYTDPVSGDGPYYYRLKIISDKGDITYSNTIELNNSLVSLVTVYPNPVADVLYVKFQGKTGDNYNLKFVNVLGQEVYSWNQFVPQNGSITYHRDARIKTGIYFLQIRNTRTDAVNVFKLNFK